MNQLWKKVTMPNPVLGHKLVIIPANVDQATETVIFRCECQTNGHGATSHQAAEAEHDVHLDEVQKAGN
jgi:hypothetical protein